MTLRRNWWVVYVLCMIVVAAGLTQLSLQMLRLERVELGARDEVEYEGAARLALWRMESWLGPRLAREATRPYFEYLCFYPNQRAYDSMWRAIVPDEVQTPSPLLTFESELIRLHFQVEPTGGITSPQVPSGNALDVALSSLVNDDRIAEKRRLLAELPAMLGPNAELQSAADEVLCRIDEMLATSEEDASDDSESEDQQKTWSQAEVSRQEQNRRMLNTKTQSDMQMVEQNSANYVGATLEAENLLVVVGSFVPIWPDDLLQSCMTIDDREQCMLVLVRRVTLGTETRLQGLLVDWNELRSLLQEQITDLFPDAELRLLRNELEANALAGRALAQVPVAMILAPPPAVVVTGLTTTRSTLLLVWLAFIIAAVAVAITLRASVAYGESRARFASAVTHELRTPLTTFRMYSEMLASGMVQGEEQRATYLATLRSEADRLSALVENVLAYARLERGRTTLNPRAIAIGRLLDEVCPALEGRAAAGGVELSVEAPADDAAEVTVDPEAVGQILLNLVDNAVKYAGPGCRMTMTSTVFSDRAEIAVQDNGPGVTPGKTRSIFDPFDRGGRPPGDTTPGLGIGLALSRGLARRLSGDLVLTPVDEGACFTLILSTGRS